VIGLRPGRAHELLPVLAAADRAVRLRDGGLRAVLECQTSAFGIKGEAEQRAVVDGWASLLNSLPHPLQVVIRTRELAPSALLSPAATDRPALAALGESYQRMVEDLAGRRRILDRRFFVVLPGQAPDRRRRTSNGAGDLEILDQRVSWVTECLRRLDLEPRRLGGRELADLLRRALNPVSSVQPIADDDDLHDLPGLIAPAALAERASSLSVSERWTRTLAVTRYPSRLRPGWLGDLQAFDGDLDLALHVQPNTGPAVMSFLERRISELTSTVHLSEDHGGRADPYRRAALHDALELQDRVAQGAERLFDVSLYLTVWADGADDLDAATRRLEALFGTRLIHTRRLLFQMRPGLVSTLPIGIDAVAVRRMLSTTALSATFPFAGGDLPTSSGLLYGINTSTRSPVIVDRFALENHNAVVFATSGAGKSFLVKVELARAILAGTRVIVIDPEGEYARLVASLGGEVIAIRPGSQAGLDPFAVTGSSPGALTTRIATLTTFLDLLAGPLGPRQRAEVEDAISHAFAKAGFADGESVDDLTWPRLADVTARLGANRATEDVAVRLERYVGGPGRWLFNQTAAAASSNTGSAVYVLAGLPEEERTPAMFLVLDRVWSRLADSSIPTLVVVDEAWWLMRHRETAAFLFRLVKTSRKRRAGLTLITQDVGDVLASPDGEPMIANSALQILMKQAPQAMPRLAELFRLTQAEQSWLLNAQRGEGLLVARGKRVPFQVIATDEESRLIEGNESRT
jgi:conjugal transfer ATP-binding protein TraC